jgi:hypothetical protein
MATQPKSDAVAAYRREIAAYLTAVQMARKWKNVKLGEMIGGVSHTTIGRALKGEHTMGFPMLLAIEDVSGIPIPESLVVAARAAQQPTRQAANEPDEIRRQVEDVAASLTTDAKRRLLQKLQEELAKSG